MGLRALIRPVNNGASVTPEALKVVIASVAYSSKVEFTTAPEIETPILFLDGTDELFEPNAVVRYLGLLNSPPITVGVVEAALIEWEEQVLQAAIKSGQPAEQVLKTCNGIFTSGAISEPVPVVSQIIIFSSLFSLVSQFPKSALEESSHVINWLNAFAAIPTIAKGINEAGILTHTKSSSLEVNMPKYTGERHLADENFYDFSKKEILPKPNEENILITSALPYVNNVPHLGNIIGSVLSADVFSRFSKLSGRPTLYICGTDEYGTATETRALELGITPRELCDKYHTIHKQIYDWFGIEFDHFGRTTTEKQTEIAQDIFLRLYHNDYLEEQTMQQLFCEKHKGFLADRFVEGVCPRCGYEDARGDQCDSCGNLLNPFELIKPRCKIDGNSPVPRESQHIFLRLDKLQPQVEEWSHKAAELGKWSRNGRIITESWLKEGLNPRCITRDLSWGTPVPLKGFEDKVLYVWFDACIGYVSITAEYTKNWEKWWKDPNCVKLYQFMGKDNVPFHTVVFPATEIGTKQPWTMLHHLSTTEYLQYEGGKFSKSRNIGVFGNNAEETGIPPSVWRFYLLGSRPETSDTMFSWSELQARNNGELLANLGNFVNRIIKFANSKYNSVVPDYDGSEIANFPELKKEVDNLLTSYHENLKNSKLRSGLELLMQISARGNQFLQDNKLDNTLFAQHPLKAAGVVGVALNLVYLLSSLTYPYMPDTSKAITEQLNVPLRNLDEEFKLVILPGHNIGKAKHLFKRIEDAQVEGWRAKYGGKNN